MSQQTYNKDTGRHIWQITPARDLIAFFLIALLLWIVYELRAIFIPLLIALILAHIFNPVVSSLEKRWGFPRPLTAAILLAVGLAALGAFLSWLGPLLVNQITELIVRLPGYLRGLAAEASLVVGGRSFDIERYLEQAELSFQQILMQFF